MSDDATKNTDEITSGDLPPKGDETVSASDASSVTGGALTTDLQRAASPAIADNSLLNTSLISGRAIGRAIA